MVVTVVYTRRWTGMLVTSRGRDREGVLKRQNVGITFGLSTNEIEGPMSVATEPKDDITDKSTLA